MKGKNKMKDNLFLYVNTDDETTDNFYVFKKNRNITIQDCSYAYPYIYNVNKWNEEEQTCSMTPCKTLKQAKQKAIA